MTLTFSLSLIGWYGTNGKLYGREENAWIPKTEYSVPQVTLPDGGFANGTVADYFGVPTKVSGSGTTLNALPFRAYALIYNEWFRDENLIDPVLIPTDSIQATGSNTNPVYGGTPFTACKYFDLFTGALPSPQKGPDVSLRLWILFRFMQLKIIRRFIRRSQTCIL